MTHRRRRPTTRALEDPLVLAHRVQLMGDELDRLERYIERIETRLRDLELERESEGV